MKIPDTVPWRSVGKTLGKGGQGQVELVTTRDDPNAPMFALKTLRNVGSKQAQDRFRREINVVKKMTHPSIVRVIDQSNEGDEFPYYVMEYHEGAVTLASVILSQSNRFYGSVMESLGLFEQIISAVNGCETFTPRIVHRDINPKNILVLPDGTIRLIDFGICQIQDGTMITLADEDVGARNYTSPECEAGTDSSIGVHSDIYSASKVLWSVITSRHAFAREQPAFNSLSLQKLFPKQPETWHLAHIFEKTIRRRPEDRFKTTNEVLDRIREVRYLVRRGFPPLEEIARRCPSCGWQYLIEFPQGHSVFGNPNPPGVVSLKCDLCGFGFVRDQRVLSQNISRMQNLD